MARKTKDSPELTHEAIEKAIGSYARAYGKLEALQEADKERSKSHFLPIHGDQKTGLIGEYWAMRYARGHYPKSATIEFAGPSQAGWDISVSPRNRPKILIQVKTVSEFSNTRIISPLHKPTRKKPWNELWLLRLDRKLRPNGFWKCDPKALSFPANGKLQSRKMPHSKKPRSGSAGFLWQDNLIEEFLKTVF